MLWARRAVAHTRSRGRPFALALHRGMSTAPIPSGSGDLHDHEDDHYAAVNKGYHTAFFYTGEYEAWQKENILQRLQLAPTHRLVDIGGGTGRFAHLLHEAGGLELPALCVDPSAGMLEEAAKLPGIETVCLGGLEFATAGETEGYDRVLIKEVVHHLTDEDLLATFKGVFSQLSPGGVCLTCTRPHVVEYPFFAAALDVWSRQQPPMEHYGGCYPCLLPRTRARHPQW
jgi:SAM-dependent methyltransferase